MPRKPVRTALAPAPSGSYSQGIRAGDFLFLSGQGPFDANGNRGGETVAEQVRQTLTNLDEVARAAGATIQDAVRVTAYLSSLEHFAEYDAVYREFFADPFPSRTTVQSDLVGMDVEIDAIVWLRPSESA
jgi:2-iminobutanoate/2-iminopropanoate deaminase